MISFEQRCKILLKRAIRDFPVLDNLNIRLKIDKLKRGSMRATRLYGGYLIIVDPDEYDAARDDEIIGAIAHELSHFEDYSKKIWIRYFFWYIHYKFSKRFMKSAEINTDMNTIRRGYGKQLAANREYIIKVKKKPIPVISGIGRPFLTPEEIKKYAKKMGKW